jgi:hypothetical protein
MSCEEVAQLLELEEALFGTSSLPLTPSQGGPTDTTANANAASLLATTSALLASPWQPLRLHIASPTSTHSSTSPVPAFPVESIKWANPVNVPIATAVGHPTDDGPVPSSPDSLPSPTSPPAKAPSPSAAPVSPGTPMGVLRRARVRQLLGWGTPRGEDEPVQAGPVQAGLRGRLAHINASWSTKRVKFAAPAEEGGGDEEKIPHKSPPRTMAGTPPHKRDVRQGGSPGFAWITPNSDSDS